MTKELIYRLRKGYQGIALGSDDMGWVFDLDTINEAADAIEALTTRVCDLEEKYLVEKGMRRLATRERDTLSAELAKLAAQEPMATVTVYPLIGVRFTEASTYGCDLKAGTKLYAAPVPPAWESLSDLLVRVEEMREASYTFGEHSKEAVDIALNGVIEIIEAAIKEQGK